MNDIFQLDYQKILTKLQPLAEAQLTTDMILNNDYDEKTKEFLKFIVDIISLSKTIEIESINNLSKKISELIKDSNKVLVDFFSNNSLLNYYDETLSSLLKEILTSIDGAKKSFAVETIKESIKEILTEFYEAIVKERNEAFEKAYKEFQSEFVDSFKEEFSKKIGDVETQIEENIKTEIEKKKSVLSKEISENVNKLLYKTIPQYLKTLNKTFNENFTKYIEKNFTAKSKQFSVANKIKKTYNAVIAPVVFASKTVKSIKDGVMSTGTKIKTKIKIKLIDKILSPIKNIKQNIKAKITKKVELAKETFLKKTEFIRKPIKFVKDWKLKVKDKLDSSGTTEIFKKYGILGVLVKSIYNAIRKRSKKFLLLSQMSFKPFKFKSVLSNTIDEFIESLEEHVAIVHGNLKLYFDKNEVEGYDVRGKKKGFFGRLFSKKKKTGESEDDSFSWTDFLFILPALFKIVRRVWRLLKKLGKLLWKATKFIFRVSRSLIKGLSRVIGRSLEKLGIKFGSKALAKTGAAMTKWGTKGVKATKIAKSARTTVKAAKTGQTVYKSAKALKSAKAGRQAYKTLRMAGAGVKTARMGATGASMAARVNPWGVVLSFGMDAVFSFVEAQNDDYMHAIFGADTEITKQQRTSYVIAGTLLGNKSLLDADWSNPGDVAMVALETAATAAKWAGVGALVGQILIPIPGLGGLIGGAIGAAAGFLFSLIGTERLAKAINWVCNVGKTVGKAIWYVVSGEWMLDLGKVAVKAIAKFGKWAGHKIANTWNATKKWCKGIADGISKVNQKINNAISSVANGVLAIGKDIGKSVLSIGKSLLSSIFPLSPLSIAGKAIKAVANKVKNFFSGDGEKDKQIQQLQNKIKTIDQVNNVSYVNAIKSKLAQHVIIPDGGQQEENEISNEAVTDVSEIMTLTGMLNQILNKKPKDQYIPVPVENNEEDSAATTAANHWAEAPATT